MMEKSPSSRDQLSAPPREVPLLMRLQLLFGGVGNQLGWLFFGFGMCFFWGFGIHADVTSIIFFRGELVQSKGVITSSSDTGFVSGGSRRSRGRHIYQHSYNFTAADGKQYQGVSYEEIGYSQGNASTNRTGDTVLIEYRPGNPNTSRIYGTRKNILPLPALLTAIFPLIGLGFIINGLRRGLRVNHLMTNGRLAFGRLISKIQTTTRINRRYVCKMTFEFTAPDQRRYKVTTSTHKTELLEEEAERLLYDPENPAKATMFDDLPGGPIIDGNGNLQVSSSRSAAYSLILPGISILLHSAILVKQLFL